MLRSIILAGAVALVLGGFPQIADAQGKGGSSARPYYGGGSHSGSHGGTYRGGSGSSHKGGKYTNPSTSNRYGRHK